MKSAVTVATLVITLAFPGCSRKHSQEPEAAVVTPDEPRNEATTEDDKQVGTDSQEPAPPPLPAPTRIRKLVSGHNHTCALLSTSSVFCWGDYLYTGWLRDQRKGSLVPIQVELSNVVDISGTESSLFALTSEGKIFGWGNDESAIKPIEVPRTSDNLAQIFSSGNCGLDKEGTAQCQHGELAGKKILAAEFGYTEWGCYLSPEKEVFCFGSNGYGAAFDTKKAITGLPGDIVSISAGADHICGLSAQGEVYCWGGNSSKPKEARKMEGISGKVLHISSRAAGDETIALIEGGSVITINTQKFDKLLITKTVHFPPETVQISAGSSHICGIVADQQVFCQGRNSSGQLGNGTRDDSETAAATQPFTTL